MKTDPNSAANPLSPILTADGDVVRNAEDGLSKREHFAALAMIGILGDSHESAKKEPSHIAEWAVKNADALIAELNKSH